MLTSEILENHGYNVINVEEGNHGEIKKRKRFSALREFMTTLTEIRLVEDKVGRRLHQVDGRRS